MIDLQKLRRIDSHCHANFPAYGDESEAVIGRALGDGTGMICVGTELGTSESAVAVASSHEGVWAAVGFHPSHLDDSHSDPNEMGGRTFSHFDAEEFRKLIKENRRKIVAVGECGLDRHFLADDGDLAAVQSGQADIFRAQVDLALEFDLPIVVHCRDLHDELFAILDDFGRQGRPVRGIAHCFTGSWTEAERYLEFGFYVSFAGMVTYKPRAADQERGETLQDVAKRVPLERLLFETDAPYLLPMPYRGRKVDGEPMRNEPAFVRHTSEFIAELRGLSVAEFEAAVLANTVECFRLK